MSRWVLVLLLFAGCRDERLQPGEGALRLVPGSLALGPAYLGETDSAQLEVQNTGRAPLTLEWSLAGDVFSLDAPPGSLAGGEVAAVRVLATPRAEGEAVETLEVRAGDSRAVATLSVRAAAVPTCSGASACTSSTWESGRRACVEAPVADGTLCGDVCLLAARCVAGRCVGEVRSCDDGNACTQDLCREGEGCVHAPAAPCPGDGRCQRGVCNPARGCELEPAADGTVCGRSGCAVADVCISGACVERDPPDGFVCAEASPCQAEGRCTADVCVRPGATALAPSWEHGGPLPDGGPPEDSYSDLFLTPSDVATLSGYFTSPPLRDARGASPVPLFTPARRCLDWDGVLACADHPTNVAAGVSVIEPSSGAPKWTYLDVLEHLPQLVAADRHTFLARLVALTPTRLAAVFETRRVEANGADSNCRTFSVVVLDRFGQKVSAWVISDPLFSRCVHPHSYGAASDAAGNLYLAFTPSGQNNPAEPVADDTLLISFTELGQVRWKGVIPKLPGGELAVARGVVVHQYAVSAFSTVDGTVVGLLPDGFRHGAATREALIPGPLAGGNALSAFLQPSLAPAWSYTLPAGQSFASDVLQLSAWTTRAGARTVALAFARTSGGTDLVGVDAATGQEAFRCPVTLPADPALAVLGAGGLGVMTPYAPPASCLVCDPRYATTRNRFFWLDLPLLGRPTAPWPGYLGGAGHDHREDPVP